MTRLVIFDFDGTLGDTRRNIVTTMKMTISELGLPSRTEGQCAATIGLPLDACFRTLYADLPDSAIDRCAEVYRRLFQENLLTIKPQAFPGVVETLTLLARQGLTLAIASSRSHASLVELTRDLGLSSLIAEVIGADDVEKAKPHPEPVLRLLSSLGMPASQTLVVGDMSVDILMGRSAGAATCGVTYGNGTPADLQQAGADHVIASITQLPSLLQAGK